MRPRVISNAAWMMAEKIVSVFGVIFVTSYVAKTFGPAVLGQITFSASLFSIIQAIAIFGTETILFKHISKCPVKGIRLMAVTRRLRITLLLVTSIPVLAYVWFAMEEAFAAFALASFVAAIFITQDTFSVFNNARLASRLNTIANSIGMLTSFAISFSVALLALNPLLLTLSIVTMTLVPYLIKRFSFQREFRTVAPPKHNPRYLRHLIYMALPLAISSIFMSAQVKMAQLFLADVGSAHELGLFAAANTISASWIFIPAALITSSFSEIFRARSEVAIKLTARLNGYVIGVSLLMLFVLVIFGEKIILALYGQAYAQSGELVIVLAIATCFSAMGTVAYRYIVKEGGFNYLLKKIICLMVVSAPLSYWLIQQYGITGAAWSILISELLSLTVMNYFFKSGIIQKIQFFSFNPEAYR
ncbi:hypothetical protein GCM10009304_23530 [Pseudomonas matsuisoli]|uniref:Membrane protein involved in the export of O-antigen and teichoic acid n=1 Tax=Pseudomonas matsuisoli TaxID=1515666 RepID=A0A917PX69_9PSED|nr:hypothetical protein GCM10009304_23530 [Pseudomonas matsuisoli]